MSGFSDVLGRAVGYIAPDVAEVGARIASNASNEPALPAVPKKPRLGMAAAGASTFPPANKQEPAMTQGTPSPADIQLTLDQELADYVKRQGTPERQAQTLIKIGVYRQDLTKQTPLLANCDEELSNAVVGQWLAEGDSELKRLVWNAAAGGNEIPLKKIAPPQDGELALAKMLEEAGTPSKQAHLLHKIASYTHELTDMLGRMADMPIERVESIVKAWLAADPGETELRKSILDAEMQRSGKAIYGAGVQAGQVVSRVSGNASTHVSSDLGGSQDGTDQRVARTIPRAPKGEGAGNRMEGTTPAPGQRDAKTPNPGSGPNDGDAGGGVNPVVVRRKGTTGNLGSVAGADGSGGSATVANDRVDGKGRTTRRGESDMGARWNETNERRKAAKESRDKWRAVKKIEDRGIELLKIAPDSMIEVIQGLSEDTDQIAVTLLGTKFADDLMSWVDLQTETLAKRDLDASITDWLSQDPDTVELKKWVAEAAATAEMIPLDLAQAIMSWKPPAAAVRVRQAA